MLQFETGVCLLLLFSFYFVLAFFTDMDIVWERVSKHTAGNSASKGKVCNLKSELEKHVREKSGKLFL